MRKTFVFRGFALLVLFLTFLPLGADQNVQAQPVSALEAQEGGDRVQAYYVWYTDGQRTALRNRLSSMQAKVTHVFDPQLVPAMVVLLPESQAKTLKSSSDVAFMEPVPEHWLLEDAPKPLLTDAPTNGVMAPTNPQVVPWNIDMVQARDVWDVDRDGVVDPGAPDGSGVRFCIIDTGFYRAHDDFQGIVSSGWSQISGENWWEDGNGHGTHVAGTANAVNNSFGVVGVMPGGAQLLIVKIFNNSGAWVTGQSNLGTAAQWCRDNGANAISMSLGGAYNATENTIFQNLYNNNIISIAAAGNDGNNTRSYPASYDSVISVAALQANEVVASFSQFPPTSYNPLSPPANVLWDVVELSGGGEGVLSTVPYVNGDVPMYQITADGNTYSGYHVEESGYTSSSGITALLVNGNLCDTTNAAWNGRIVLCQRGSVSFAVKINNVRSSGGLGVAIYNNVPGNFGATCGGACTQPSIPAISLSQEDGQALLPSVGSSSTLIVYDGSDCVDCTGGYDYMSGTSMATPGVAAGVAWVWDSCGGPTGITNQQLRQLLRDSAKDLAGTRYDANNDAYTYGAGYDVHSGWGLIQLKNALELGHQRFGSTCPLTLLTQPPERVVCTASATSTTFNVTLNDSFLATADMTVSGYPAGAATVFSPDPVVHPVKDTVLTLSGLDSATAGNYTLNIQATDTSDPNNIATSSPRLYLFTSTPLAPVLTTPADASDNIPLQPTFSWEPVAQTYTYDLQIATDPGLTHIVHSASGLHDIGYTGPSLSQDTVYYWRVWANNPCGMGSYSPTFSFRTQIPPDCADLIRNGTFEAGRTEWTETFGSGRTAVIGEWGVPHLGTWYAWMGNYRNANDSIRQTVTIPAGATGSLTYWYYITSGDSCGRDFAGVQVSGSDIVNYDLCALTSMTVYAQHSVDLSSYADTNSEIRFWATNNNNSHSSFRVDDVSLVMCLPATPLATVCGNLPSSYGMACHRALTGSTLRLGDTWGDQNGIQFDVFKAGENAQVQVNVQGTPTSTPYLRVWFDWDSDGIFDTSDVVYSGDVVVGTNTLDTIPVPGTLTAPVNYRFRLYDGVPIGLMALDNYSYGDVDGGDITDGESPDPTPTAVTLASFTATPQGNAILVTWETASELNNIGFNLYRSEWVTGPYVQLNDTLIPPQNPGTVLGGVYEWLDVAVRSGMIYYYKLEDIDIHGIRTFHEPVWAMTSAPPYRVYLPIVLRP